MADLMDFADGSPVAAAPAGTAPEVSPRSQANNLLSSFDPLMGAPAPASAPSTSAGGAGAFGLPKEVAAAFAAASAGGPPTAGGAGQAEWLPSGLSVQGQAELMKQIEESAKKMSKPDTDASIDEGVKRIEAEESGKVPE